jgi:ATP-dependent protease ClpP protease subunit
MPSWHELLEEVKTRGSVYDIIRREAAARLADYTKRNVIVYYSGWLQKSGVPGLQVNDADKNGLMTVVHGLDRTKGLDLILHTPGGETAATESIVDYLHSMFGTDIRAIVPQLAMSAGTMIACACKTILMGKQSSLGPIDPQFRGIPAHGVVEEFRRAYEEIKADPAKIPVWQPIIAKYSPTFIGECEKAIDWSNEMVREWLARGMFAKNKNASKVIDKIIADLGDHALMKSHARHLSASTCKSMGLAVEQLEADQALQDLVLTLHHACIHTLGSTPAVKIIENDRGVAFIQVSQAFLVQGAAPGATPGGFELTELSPGFSGPGPATPDQVRRKAKGARKPGRVSKRRTQP